MPIAFITGFNGMAPTPTTALQNLFVNAVTGTSVGSLSPDNVINNTFFGSIAAGVAFAKGLPLFNLTVKQPYTITAPNYAGIDIAKSSTDPRVNCLRTYVRYSGAGTADRTFGPIFQFHNIAAPYTTAGMKPWRMGFRLYAPPTTGTGDNTPSYQITFELGWAVAAGAYTINIQAAAYVGKEVYVELYADATKFELYIDDVLHTSAAHGKTGVPYFLMIFKEHYVNAGAARTTTGFEMKDMYIQIVEGDGDQRLGSATQVMPVYANADSAVEFSRPEGYASNASVVGEAAVTAGAGAQPDSLHPVPSEEGRYLIADEPGQQDLYGVDASLASTALASVDAVCVRTLAGTPTLGTRVFSAIAATTGAQKQADIPTSTVPGNFYHLSHLHMPVDPADGSRWTMAKLANLKIGTKFIS